MGSKDNPSSFTRFFSVESSSHVVESAYARVSSLAAIKDLKWLCTSWQSPRLSLEEGQNLYATLYQGPAKEGKDGGLCENALCIGSSSITRAKLFCVFPHIRRDVRLDEDLLEKWHDRVIRPAFEQAWRQTGWDGQRGIPHTPASFESIKEQSESTGRSLHERNPKRFPESYCETIEEEWPSEFMIGSQSRWDSPWDDCLDLAWQSMCDRVESDPELYEMQDMFLVLSIPGFPVAASTTQEAFQLASKHWECSIDPRFLNTEHFNVYYRTTSHIGNARTRFWPGFI